MTYICNDCIDEYKLPTSIATCLASCEICGPVKGDWSPKFVTWEQVLYRYFGPGTSYNVSIPAQLELLKKGQHWNQPEEVNLD